MAAQGDSTVTLSLVVLRCKDLASSLRFYQLLGLRFVQEQHGKGPIHYAASLNGGVFELYPALQGDSSFEPARLGFTVASLKDALQTLETAKIQILSTSQNTAQGSYAVLLDPDGRKIELTELSENLYR